MKYKCIPCNHEFEAKSGTKPRCPRCLNIHDVEPVKEDENPAKGATRSYVAPVGVLLVAAMVAVAYFLVKDDAIQDTGDTSVDPKDLFEQMGIPEEEAVRPCDVKESVIALAEKFAGGKSGEAGLDALFAGINSLKETKWRPHHQREPRVLRPISANKLAKKLLGDEREPFMATSYELACLLSAAAKATEIDAQIVEIQSFKGEKKPADPDGKFGRYAVALSPDESKVSAHPVFDLFGNRSKSAAIANITILNDAQQMAPYFGIGALSLLVKQEMSKALSLNDIAVKLDKDSPYFRAGRGFIFAATGVPSESLVEFEKALKSRADPVQRANLAEILLLINPMDKRAETEIQAALKEMPDFARAHALKGMIHLVRQEKNPAETELALAERLDPASPAIAMYWARYYAVTMESDKAVAKAKKAVELADGSVAMLLGLASIYREVARFDDMRGTLDQILDNTDTPQMAEQIKQIFGYDPDQGEETADSADDETGPGGASELPSGDFKLKLGDGLGKKKGPGLGSGGRLDLDLNL